jgi:uncharacterized membrane protein YfcA
VKEPDDLAALELDDLLLQRLFAVVLIVVALRMLIPRAVRSSLHLVGFTSMPKILSQMY